MTRPASLRPQGSPFVKRNDRHGKKLEIDPEIIDSVGYNHKLNYQLNEQELKILRQELTQAEANGRYSKARKLRREINRLLETNLAIQSTWCRGCNNYLHRCKCPGEEALGVSRSTAYRRRKKEAEKQKQIKELLAYMMNNL